MKTGVHGPGGEHTTAGDRRADRRGRRRRRRRGVGDAVAVRVGVGGVRDAVAVDVGVERVGVGATVAVDVGVGGVRDAVAVDVLLGATTVEDPVAVDVLLGPGPVLEPVAVDVLLPGAAVGQTVAVDVAVEPVRDPVAVDVAVEPVRDPVTVDVLGGDGGCVRRGDLRREAGAIAQREHEDGTCRSEVAGVGPGCTGPAGDGHRFVLGRTSSAAGFRSRLCALRIRAPAREP